MKFFAEAIDAIQRNIPALCIYLAIFVCIDIAQLGGDHLMADPDTGEIEQTTAGGLYVLVKYLVIAAGGAVAQSIAFSRIGREIDRPLQRRPRPPAVR